MDKMDTAVSHSDSHDTQLAQLVSFRVSDEEFGIDILQVQEIIRMLPIAIVPSAPAFVKGVIDLRGEVIPIIDMRKRFKLPSIPYDNETRIIVVHTTTFTVGFIVDAVCEVIRISENAIEKPPAVVDGEGANYIKGVSKLEKGLLILLDLNGLISLELLEELMPKAQAAALRSAGFNASPLGNTPLNS